MPFREIIAEHFQGALTEDSFVAQTAAALRERGFTPDNSIACVGVCRDELTYSLVHRIQATWGEAFNLSSLAGMLFLGKTGFLAAHSHSPQIEARERYVFIALPHLALGAHAEVGLCSRRGRMELSNACGALVALRNELERGTLSFELDSDDIEMSLLRQRMFRSIRYGDKPDLIALTKIAHGVILEDLERMVRLTVDPANSDYAVLTGIQLHGPEEDYAWPGTLYCVVDGQRHDLPRPTPPPG